MLTVAALVPQARVEDRALEPNDLADVVTLVLPIAARQRVRAALAAVGTGTRAERLAAWTAAYSPTSTGQSLAYLLRAAIRNVINAAADGGQGPLDLASAYTTLSGEFAPDATKPPSADEERAAIDQLLSR